MDKKILKLLYYSFDSLLNLKEKKALDQAMKHSDELKREMDKLVIMRKKIEGSKEYSFKPFFADRVMQQINRISVNNDVLFFESLIGFFKPVIIAAILLIIAVTSYNITNTKQFSIEGILAIPQVTLEEAFDPSLILYTED